MKPIGTDTTITDVDGERAAFLLTTIPDGAPVEVREGLARRRIVALGGQCPCGAIFIPPNRAQRRAAQRRREPIHVAVKHENGCPAITSVLVAALRKWAGDQ
jgi:hypothetical protein